MLCYTTANEDNVMMRIRKATLLATLLLFCSACGHTQEPLSTQQRVKSGVVSATLSNNGRYALISSVNQPTALWDRERNLRRHQWFNSRDHNGIIANSISSDNRYALTAERYSLALWDIDSGTTLKYWRVRNPIKSIALGRDAHYALVGYSTGQVEYIDLNDGTSVRKMRHNEAVNAVALSRDERYAITASDDNTAILWNIQTGKPVHRFKHSNHVTQAVISPHNTYVATAAAQGKIKLWDRQTGKLLHTLTSHRTSVSAMAFANDEKRFVAGIMPQRVQIWQVTNGQLLKSWHIPKPSMWKPSATIIRAVGFSTDGQQVLTEDSNGRGQTWPAL